MYAHLSNDPNTVVAVEIEPDTLKEWCLKHYNVLMEMGAHDHELAIRMMRGIEPFKSNWDQTEEILDAERAYHG